MLLDPHTVQQTNHLRGQIQQTNNLRGWISHCKVHSNTIQIEISLWNNFIHFINCLVLKLLFIVYPTSRCTCLTVQIIYINLILTQFVGVSRVLSIPWNKPIIQLRKLLNLIQKHKICFCLINYEHNFVLLDRKKQQTKRISLFFVLPKLQMWCICHQLWSEQLLLMCWCLDDFLL